MTSANPSRGNGGNKYPTWFKWCCWVLLGVVTVITVQPSLRTADIFVGSADMTFITNLTDWIPILGGLIRWLVKETVLVSLVAIAISGVLNYNQMDWVFGEVTENSKKRRWRSWAAELIQNFLKYPIYAGGWIGMVKDAPHLDMSKMILTNVVLAIVSTLAVEGLARFFAEVLFNYRKH